VKARVAQYEDPGGQLIIRREGTRIAFVVLDSPPSRPKEQELLAHDDACIQGWMAALANEREPRFVGHSPQGLGRLAGAASRLSQLCGNRLPVRRVKPKRGHISQFLRRSSRAWSCHEWQTWPLFPDITQWEVQRRK
jgi:hypothetical protein